VGHGISAVGQVQGVLDEMVYDVETYEHESELDRLRRELQTSESAVAEYQQRESELIQERQEVWHDPTSAGDARRSRARCIYLRVRAVGVRLCAEGGEWRARDHGAAEHEYGGSACRVEQEGRVRGVLMRLYKWKLFSY
jgi:hypothetical protein